MYQAVFKQYLLSRSFPPSLTDCLHQNSMRLCRQFSENSFPVLVRVWTSSLSMWSALMRLLIFLHTSCFYLILYLTQLGYAGSHWAQQWCPLRCCTVQTKIGACYVRTATVEGNRSAVVTELRASAKVIRLSSRSTTDASRAKRIYVQVSFLNNCLLCVLFIILILNFSYFSLSIAIFSVQNLGLIYW